MRSIHSVLVLTMILAGVPATVSAADTDEKAQLAPSPAVQAAWEREQRRPEPAALKALYGSYVAFQGLDVWSTVAARRNGAREQNPLMSGNLAQGLAFKSLMAAGTITATKAMARKNRKAAFVTMIAANTVTALVVANNARNARRAR
jgi:hypothetical protein